MKKPKFNLRQKWRDHWTIKKILDITILSKGINHHHHVQYTGQKYVILNKKKYLLDLDAVFIRQRSIFSKIADRIRRSQKYFSIFYLETSTTPIKIHEQKHPKLTAEVLDIAKRSSALSKALSELFRTRVSGRSIIFIIIVMVVMVLVYLIMSGGITIPEELLPI